MRISELRSDVCSSDLGAFLVGAGLNSLAESIPVAGTMGIKVVSIDYRMAPEYAFPSASNDVEAVYAELLKQYRPRDIGIYGCSAGGILTAMTMAWRWDASRGG